MDLALRARSATGGDGGDGRARTEAARQHRAAQLEPGGGGAQPGPQQPAHAPPRPTSHPPPPPSTGGGVGGGAHGDAVRDAHERRGVTARARVSAVGPRLPAAGIDAALGVGGPPCVLPLALAATPDHHNDEGAEVDDARGAARLGQDQHRVSSTAAPAVRLARAAVCVFGRSLAYRRVSSPTSPPHQLGEGRRLPLERIRPDRLRLPASRRTRLHRRPGPRPAGAGLPHCHHRLLPSSATPRCSASAPNASHCFRRRRPASLRGWSRRCPARSG